jgi:hypothetical protein
MKASRNLLSLIILSCCILTASAQPSGFCVGVKAGIGIPSLTAGSKSTPLSEGYSTRLGLNGGIVTEFRTQERLSLRVEFNYSSQGGKRNGIQALPLMPELTQLWQTLPDYGVTTDNYMYADIKSEAILNYFEIPVLAKATFGLGSKVHFYINAGPYFGYLMNAKNITSGSSSIYIDGKGTVPLDAILQQAGMQGIGEVNFTSDENITSDTHRFNVGGEGAVGFELIMNSGKLFIEGGGNYGLIQIQKDDANGANHTGAGTVSVGYLINM